MVTSFDSFEIQRKLVSSKYEVNCDTFEYECKLPGEFSNRKYHLSKVVTPEGEHRSYSVS